jgi:hypothetical protein
MKPAARDSRHSDYWIIEKSKTDPCGSESETLTRNIDCDKTFWPTLSSFCVSAVSIKRTFLI